MMSHWKHAVKWWFQHDGAPPHFGRNVREFLNRHNSINVESVAADQSVGLLGHLILWESIQNAFTVISNTNGIFERVRQSLIRRMEACILAEGGTFEHFL